MAGPATEEMLNGVDMDLFRDTMDAVREHSDMAQFTFRAKSRWAYGAHCCTTIQDFSIGGHTDRTRPKPHLLEADEPEVLLGDDIGPSATEALLHALASCLTGSLVYHASAQGVTIDQLELDMEGRLDVRGFMGIDESVRNGFQEIHVTFNVLADAPDEKIRALCDLAQKRSPVFDTVSHPTPIKADVKIMDSQGPEEAATSV